MSNQRHEFAIYFDFPNHIEQQEFLRISDEQIHHRLTRVLRFQINDLIIIFNKNIHLLTQIKEITKKDILLKVLEINKNYEFKKQIVMAISLLKRESLEEAIYFSTELGANIIQPIITDKTHQKKLDSKELERLKKVIISAAEQSKNFKFPVLMNPISLDQFIKNYSENNTNIFFDANGKDLPDVLKDIDNEKVININLFIGPEADLSNEEKISLKNANFHFCKLTPTILRASTAVGLSLGIFRSVFQ